MSVYSADLFTAEGRLRGSYVYMLLCQDLEAIYIKVGRSASPLARLNDLRTSCPIAPEIIAIVEVSTRKRAGELELALHAAFDQWRTNGEWFRFSAEERPQFNDAWKPILQRFSHSSRKLSWQKYSVPAIINSSRERRGFLRISFANKKREYDIFRNGT